jgi:hypothetical protein
VRVQFQVSDDCLQNVGLGLVWLVPCVRSLTYSSKGSVSGLGRLSPECGPRMWFG